MVSYNSFPVNFNIDKALELANLSNEAYAQYKAWQTKQSWQLPHGYALESSIYAVYEKDNMPLGFIASKLQDIYIVWRGTQDIEEWIEDAKFDQIKSSFLKNNEKVAMGFDQMYVTGDAKVDSPQKTVMNYLSKLSANTYKNLWITGHSLGGALATLNIYDIVTNTIHTDASLYSFAAPRVGDANFATTFDNAVGVSWRVVNSNDEVPNLPPEHCPPILHTFHYEHVNRCFPITFGNSWNLAKNHSIEGYIDQLQQIKTSNQVAA
jgi:predicted lipase